MKQWSVNTLEYTHIKEKIKEYAFSTIGQDLIAELTPSADIDKVKLLLKETEEGMHLLRLKGEASLRGVYDIRNSLIRASIAGMLNEQECLEIGSTIAAGRKIKSLLRQIDKEDVYLFPLFTQKTEQIVSLEELQHKIELFIDQEGVLRDGASDTLKQIRLQMSSLKQRINETLSQLFRNANYSKMIQESIVTIRNNRYVIPVKHEYRGMLKGIIHDQSSSGATLFIEPQAVFHLNNQLRSLELDEEKERERILKELTSFVAEEAEHLRSNLEILTRLDVILAKAQWGTSQKATCAHISSSVSLKKAKHPFIPRDRVVPIDVSLANYRAMLVTGPNAGGKTVILKTVGLFALMTQSGIPILAEEESSMPVFSGVFADIGDEQSIEQSLSTFSGHLSNIIQILTHMDEDSLILLDELGAGTDPVEGTALATSILEYIINKGCTTITTTHFSELKYFAYNHPNVINASVEFDVASLRPTYRLIMGTPGSSNAFAISERLGLPMDIIKKAKTYLSGEENSFEKGIKHLLDAQKEAEVERERERQLRADAQTLYEDLLTERNEWEEKKAYFQEEARKNIQQMVDEAEIEVELALERLRTSKDLKEHHLIEAKTQLRKAVPEVKPLRLHKNNQLEKEEIQVGDEVLAANLNQEGTVLEIFSEEEVLVQIGALKMKIKSAFLEKKKPKKNEMKNTVYSVTRSDDTVRPELHLRGKAIDEAMLELEKYLDDVLLTGYKKVSIVHGKGTGALRIAVQQYLRQHRSVKEFRLGYHGEGGAGVTVVELK